MKRKRYRLLGRLEAGELAELYKGVRDEHERVIIKLFLERTSAKEYAQTLAETSRALAPLREGGILHEVEIGLVRGRLAVVREAFDGFNLGTALQRLSTKEVLLHPPIALFMVIRLLDAVSAAHDAGVVHGAITPGNILLSKQGQVALCDFGAIRALKAAPALKAFVSRGRSAYRAVEIEQGEEPTVASDIYSLGAIAYELLTLREAALSKGANVSTRRDALPAPSRLDRRLNARLDPLIMRALETLPERRYKSCQEFSSALRNFVSTNGGVPRAADVQKFVGELFPQELSLSLGPAAFSEAFTLTEVEGADLHPDVSGDLALRSSFSGGAAPDLEDSRTDQAAPGFEPFDPASSGLTASPPLEEPRFDEGTEPGRAGPLEHGWHAPPAQLSRSGPKAAVASGAQPQHRTRVKLVEDFHPLGDDANDTDRVASRSPPTAPSRPLAPPQPEVSVSQSQSQPSGPVPLGITGARHFGTTGRRMLVRIRERRRSMGLIAALVAGIGLASFAFGLKQYQHGRGSPPPAPRSLVTRAPPLLAPVEKPPAPVPPTPQPAEAVKLEPVEGDDAHSHSAGSYLTLLSNTPANISIDGVRQRAKTPVKKLPVSPGAHHIALESVRTGERIEFNITVQRGEHPKIEQHFELPPGYH